MGKRQRQNKTKLKGNLPIVELTKVQRRCLDTSGLILVFASLIALNIGHSVNASSNGDGVIAGDATTNQSSANQMYPSGPSSINTTNSTASAISSAPARRVSEEGKIALEKQQSSEVSQTDVTDKAKKELNDSGESDQKKENIVSVSETNQVQTPKIQTAGVTISRNSSWSPAENLISARNTLGQEVGLDDIQTVGTVNSAVVGTYFIQYGFKDVSGGKDVTQFSSITVTDNNDPVHYKQAGENILPSVPVGALASIKTKDTFLLTKSSWMPNNNFISATNSDGESVNPDKISIDGTVNPTVVGNYFIRFSFTDTKLKTLVANMAKVTVVNTLPLESGDLSQGGYKESHLASFFPSTTNYPSTKTVYLPDDPNFKPDENEISKYFLQYVNELRTLNGQTTLTISASDTARAQQRARAIVDSFNHETVSSATQKSGTNAGITDQMHSNQEIAYYMVMAWYDETDNPEPLGDGHYGHRANLLYGGPTMGLSFYRSSAGTAEFTDYYAFEAPIYTDFLLYLKAKSMANAMTNPVSVPLPNITFVYVNAATLATLRSYLNWSQVGHADPKVENNAKPSLSLA